MSMNTDIVKKAQSDFCYERTPEQQSSVSKGKSTKAVMAKYKKWLTV